MSQPTTLKDYLFNQRLSMFGIDLHQFLNVPCEIDKDLYESVFKEVRSNKDGLIQHIETVYICEKTGVEYCMTFMEKDDQYFYLGVLPEFKR